MNKIWREKNVSAKIEMLHCIAWAEQAGLPLDVVDTKRPLRIIIWCISSLGIIESEFSGVRKMSVSFSKSESKLTRNECTNIYYYYSPVDLCTLRTQTIGHIHLGSWQIIKIIIETKFPRAKVIIRQCAKAKISLKFFTSYFSRATLLLFHFFFFLFCHLFWQL